MSSKSPTSPKSSALSYCLKRVSETKLKLENECTGNFKWFKNIPLKEQKIEILGQIEAKIDSSLDPNLESRSSYFIQNDDDLIRVVGLRENDLRMLRKGSLFKRTSNMLLDVYAQCQQTVILQQAKHEQIYDELSKSPENKIFIVQYLIDNPDLLKLKPEININDLFLSQVKESEASEEKIKILVHFFQTFPLVFLSAHFTKFMTDSILSCLAEVDIKMQSDNLFCILNEDMKQNVLTASILVCNLFTVYGNCFRWDSSNRDYCHKFDLRDINKIFTLFCYIALYGEFVEDNFSNKINNSVFLLSNIFIQFSLKMEDELFEKIKEDKKKALFAKPSQAQKELFHLLNIK